MSLTREQLLHKKQELEVERTNAEHILLRIQGALAITEELLELEATAADTPVVEEQHDGGV